MRDALVEAATREEAIARLRSQDRGICIEAKADPEPRFEDFWLDPDEARALVPQWRVRLTLVTPPVGEVGAFLAAIWADPGDDAPKLIYADWLEEHGQTEAGEYIRLGIHLRGMPRCGGFREHGNKSCDWCRVNGRKVVLAFTPSVVEHLWPGGLTPFSF